MSEPNPSTDPSVRSNRRQFLQQAGAGVLAAGFAPAILGAEDKAGTKPVIVGEGDYQYECHHGWGELPDSIKWRNTHGVTVDRDGFIYVKHQGRENAPCDTIVVFDAEGKYVRSFGQEYAGGGHGIDIRYEDGGPKLYLCDTHNRQVIKCDLNGEVEWKKQYPTEADLYDNINKFRPTNVCFGPTGDLYIGDGYGSNFLHQYDSDGKWIRSWGGGGAQPGKMQTPHGQWLDDRPGREPMLVIADRANSRLQYFTLDGKPVSVIQGVLSQKEAPPPTEADLEKRMAAYTDFPAEGCLPISFPADVDTQGELMLVPDLHARVLIFDGKNQLVGNLGYDGAWTAEVLKMQIRGNPATWVDGKFVHPHDACFDKDGNIFVTEWVEAGRVTFLKRV
ncbi:MAG: twin-arginine translocation signal domain-containing protein [Planctomycetaceae bacterium]